MIFSPDAVPDRFDEEMPVALMLRPSQLQATAADSAQMPVAAARIASRYDRLRLPMSIIWRRRDKLVDQEAQSSRLADDILHATPLELADGAHMVHYCQLDHVTAAIEDLATLALA